MRHTKIIKMKKGGIFKMQKIIRIFILMMLVSLLVMTSFVYAASLDAIKIDTNKEIVRPGEEVTLTINFGQSLGTYTFDIAYDNQIFEYVSAEGGTPNNLGDKVKVVFHDSSGGSNPRENMSITFKAKDGITTSNPTEFSITADGLANHDASVTYDDITVPIIKNVTVEPQYVDYTFSLTYTGDIIENEEKEMKLSYSSPMGRYYEHARLVAEATTPDGASVKLVGIDESQLEHDIIQSGWGDAQGYKIGGKDVVQELAVAGLFSDAGNYSITLKLIDRDSSDAIIAQQKFDFTVLEAAAVVPPTTPEEGNEEEIVPPEEEIKQPEETPEETPEEIVDNEPEVTPSVLPSTGLNLYIVVAILIVAIASIGLIKNTKQKIDK